MLRSTIARVVTDSMINHERSFHKNENYFISCYLRVGRGGGVVVLVVGGEGT